MQTGIVACQHADYSLRNAILLVIGQIKDKRAAPMVFSRFARGGETFGASRWHFYRHFLPARRWALHHLTPTTTKTCPWSFASASCDVVRPQPDALLRSRQASPTRCRRGANHARQSRAPPTHESGRAQRARCDRPHTSLCTSFFTASSPSHTELCTGPILELAETSNV